MNGLDETEVPAPIETLPKFPVWVQAASDVVTEFDYGDVIPHEWLAAHLELSPREGLMTVNEHRALDFEAMAKMDGLRNTLLEQHQRHLENVRGVGYRVVPPQLQTDAAMRQLTQDMRRSLGKTMKVLLNVNESLLTLDDLRENTEARSKLAWIALSAKLAPGRLQSDTPKKPN